MDPALILLLRLKGRAFGRVCFRQMRTVRGAFIMLFTFGTFALMIGPSVVVALSMPAGMVGDASIIRLREFVPLAMLGYTMLSLISSIGERAVYFSPSEINFLFPAPLSRRQLLLYKISNHIMGALFLACVMSLTSMMFVPRMLAAASAAFWGVLFLNALLMCVQLVAATISEQAYTRGRRLALVVIGVLVTVGIAQVMAQQSASSAFTMLQEFHNSIAGRVLLAPFDLFANVLVSRSLFPELAIWTAAAGMVVIGLYAFAIKLDANYLDTSIRVSQRMQEMLQRRATGGSLHLIGSSFANTRLSRFRWLGQAAPIAWRQWSHVVAGSRGLLLVGAIATLGLGAVAFFLVRKQTEIPSFVPLFVAGGLAYVTFLTSAQGPWAFRSDLDLMSVFKGLPLPARTIVVGQLLPVIILFSIAHIVVMLAAWPLLGGDVTLWLACLAFIVPFNALMFGVENLLFLWFPKRIVPGSQDITIMGRTMLVMFVKSLLVLGVFGLAAIFAGGVYWLTKSLPLALCIGWVLLFPACVLNLLLLANAFERFDVSREEG